MKTKTKTKTKLRKNMEASFAHIKKERDEIVKEVADLIEDLEGLSVTLQVHGKTRAGIRKICEEYNRRFDRLGSLAKIQPHLANLAGVIQGSTVAKV